jgi:hypothetical protein
MKMSDKRTWDKLLYGLIYPGFLGSMLYELIPPNESNFTMSYFFGIPDNYIRYGIIIFYILDYAHLYGDMEGIIKDPNKKSLSYFLADILTSLGYLVSFIALKIPNYWFTVIIFGLVPWLFLWYKRKNEADIKFLVPYGCVTAGVLVCRLLCEKWMGLVLWDDRALALIIVSVNVVAYFAYIGWYYEKRSRHIDETVVYPDARNAA